MGLNDGAGTGMAGSLRIRDPRHWVELFANAFGRGSFEAVAELARFTHPEFRGRQPQTPDAVGPEGLLDFFARVYALIPDLRGTILRTTFFDDGVYIEVRLSGTLGGRPVEWEACDRFHFKDGLVAERMTYLDPLPLFQAIAARPNSWRTWWRSGLGLPIRARRSSPSRQKA